MGIMGEDRRGLFSNISRRLIPGAKRRISQLLSSGAAAGLRRSLSARELHKRGPNSAAATGWSSSLQSLVEDDLLVSESRDIRHNEGENHEIHEQVHVNPGLQAETESSFEETTPSPVLQTHLYRKPSRDQDGLEVMSTGSQSQSRCSKLRRQNACRQARRSVSQLTTAMEHAQDHSQDNHNQATGASGQENVRSRSLNHLDRLETASRPEVECPHLGVPNVVGRRHLLSRSQVSSSEYFSVCFDIGEDASLVHGKEEFVPAVRGTTLESALASACERRSIDLSSCDILLDGCRAPSHLLHQDTSPLGGKSLRLVRRTQTSTSSGSSSSRRSERRRAATAAFFSVSADDTHELIPAPSTDSISKKQPARQRWSALFGNSKDARMDSLSDLLNQYAAHGVPKAEKELEDESEEAPLTEEELRLENDWRDIVRPDSLSERQQQQQTALWELISTELAYMNTLRVVTDLFVACLRGLQTASVLTDIEPDQLFSNIGSVVRCHERFWRTCLCPIIRQMRSSNLPVNVSALKQSFINMRHTHRAYFRYCGEQSRCQRYCRDTLASNDAFTAYLVWCETRRECNRLRLLDILVRPMQRLTKYGLLLKAILKNTESAEEKEALEEMITAVDEFVDSVNSSLRQRQDSERLQALAARIESYDAVEARDDDLQNFVARHSHLDLGQPMPGCAPERRRRLLLEGDLRLRDALVSKLEVHCFLLTDVLLICKPCGKKAGGQVRVIRPPYLVNRLIVHELSRDTPTLGFIYLNELGTASAAFALQCGDAARLRAWHAAIRRSQCLYEQARDAAVVTADLSSSRASLAHSHSGSVDNEPQRTASVSSDEGAPPSTSRSPRAVTPNTLAVQPPNLGQSLPNLSAANTLHVPGSSTVTRSPAASSCQLSPTHRGISYPPPSPTRANLRRGLAISPKNPPLMKTAHVTSASVGTEPSEYIVSGGTRRSEPRRHHTAGAADDIRRNEEREPQLVKRLSWNCAPPDT